MNIADVVLNLIAWLVQHVLANLLPHNALFLSYDTLLTGLIGLEHNFAWALAGLDKFFNISLLFTILLVMITAEITFWFFRATKWVIEMIRG
jgi:hypothetical protein